MLFLRNREILLFVDIKAGGRRYRLEINKFKVFINMSE